MNQNRDAQGRFTGSGKWKDPYYRRMYQIGYYYEKDQNSASRHAYNKNVKTLSDKYLGACTCPRCEKHGYAELRKKRNGKTDTTYPRYLGVHHHHSEHGKTVYDGFCYVGVVRND